MNRFFVTLEASAVFSLDTPTIEVLIGGVVVSSASVTAHTGVGTSIFSFELDFTGNYPSSLSFRFNDGLSEPGRSVTIHNASVNGYNITSDLTATVLALMQSGAFNTAAYDHLFGRVTPALSDLPAPTITDAPGFSNPNLRGTGGRDVIDASDGDDRVWGADGDDVLSGGAGQNTLYGGTGNDLILGGTDNDIIWGEGGDDLLYGSDGDDLILGGLGNDVLNGGNGLDVLVGDAGNDILYGEAGDDILLGDAGADFLYGDAGTDYLLGGAGNDTIYGGADTDYISGAGNNDTIYGEGGDDSIDGGGGIDTIDGGAGSDNIFGGAGNDIISGGTEDDYILGDTGGDTLNGDDGNDGLMGGTGTDTLNGGNGADALYGHSLDSLTASSIVVADPNVFFNMYTGSFYKYIAGTVDFATAQANAAATTLNGVGGHLVTIASATENSYVEALAAGATVWIGASDAANEGDWRWLSGVEGGLQFWSGTSTGSAVNYMYTNWNTGEPNDVGGADGAAMLSGGVWADQTVATLNGYIIEWEGSLWNEDNLIDTLSGGAGGDLLYGGGGNDILNGDDDNDKIWGGAGDDTANGGNGADALFGDAGNDTINGDAGNDIIHGGAGIDTIDGGADNDIIYLTNGDFAAGESITGNTGTDTIQLDNTTTVDFTTGTLATVEILNGSAGSDSVTIFLTHAATTGMFTTINLGTGTDSLFLQVNGMIDISAATLSTLTSVENGYIIGTAGDDVLTLTSAQFNTIIAGTGTLDMVGGTGDTINLNATAADLNTLAATDSSISGVEFISFSTAAAGITIDLTNQTEGFTITGGGFADTITGGSGDSTITGGAGADIIVTGDGDNNVNLANGDFAAGESITGGSGTDTIILTNATTVDFRIGALTDIAQLSGSSGNDTVTFAISQFYALSGINMAGGTDVLNITFSGTVDITAETLPAISNTETGNLSGSGGNNDIITLTGSQLDTILIGASAVIDFGAGTGDTLNLASTSTRLNTLGATNSSIAEIEAISFAGAAAGITLTLSGQTEAFTITGSAFADTITSGSGNDTINLANGDFGVGETLIGGAGTDAIVLTNTTTVDFTTGTLSSIETLTGSSGGDTITMAITDVAGMFTAVNTGGGTDNIYILASGTVDISAAAIATYTSVENGYLTGSSGNDVVTLTGTQLNTIIAGSGTVNLGGGSSDTIVLTSTSTDLNTLGTTDSSIQGVEIITVSGSPAITITLSGQTEDFTVNGGGGADTITGGKGSDVLYGNAGNDTIISSSVDTLASQIAAITGSYGVTYNSTTGSFYLFVNTALSWTAANTAAAGNIINGVAGHLVQINNAAENSAVDTLAGTNDVWIGLNDAATEGTFKFIGGPMDGISTWLGNGVDVGGAALNGTYSNWDTSTGPDNPDDGNGGASQDYVRQRNGGTWRDETDSSTTYRYVIEWEGSQLLNPTKTTVLSGGAGTDILTGSAGQDYFLFKATSWGSIDTINGYNKTHMDKIDIGDMLTGFVQETSDPDVFARLTVSGADLLLEVDQNGSGSSYSTVATLIGMGTSGLNIEEMLANDLLIMAQAPAVLFNFTWGTGNYLYTSSTLGITTFKDIDIGYGISGNDMFLVERTSLQARLEYLNAGAPNGLVITGSSSSDDILVEGIVGSVAITANLGTGNDTITITTAGNSTVSGGVGNDTITTGSGADTITGGGGADIMNGGSGNDTFNLANGDWAAGESITGGIGTDGIILTNTTTVDFSTGTLATVELLTASTGNDTITLAASQWADFTTIDMVSGTDVLNVMASGDISAAGIPTVNNVDTGNLVGSANNDTVTMTGAQLNAILIGGGTINFNGGTADTLNLTSTSTDLNGLNDASLQGLEIISASGAGAAVTITVSGQTEGFTITGSGFNDTITGGSGNDTIDGGNGNDTLNGNGGSGDTVSYASAGSAVTVSLLLQGSAQNTVGAGTDTLTNFENLTGSNYNDILTGDGNANVIHGGAGNDTVYGGNGNDTLYGDSGSDVLYGEAGNDTIYSGSADTLAAQISAILAANSGVVYNSTTGSFYKYVNSSVSWTTANTAAAAATINGVAGHLVQITNSAENSAIDTLGGGNSVWIGLNDTATEGTFKFIGGPMNGINVWIGTSGGAAQNNLYTNWRSGKPDATAADDDYVRQRDGGQWSDETSGKNNRYVIEWEGSQLLTPTESTTLSGSAGTDTLYGSAGQDIFLFEAATWGTNDVISSYDKTDLDKIDIGDLLTGYTPGVSDNDAFAQFTVSGANLLLQVDQNGTVGGSSYTTIATLSGLGTSGLNVEEMVANGLLIMT